MFEEIINAVINETATETQVYEFLEMIRPIWASTLEYVMDNHADTAKVEEYRGDIGDYTIYVRWSTSPFVYLLDAEINGKIINMCF